MLKGGRGGMNGGGKPEDKSWGSEEIRAGSLQPSPVPCIPPEPRGDLSGVRIAFSVFIRLKLICLLYCVAAKLDLILILLFNF